MKYFVENIEKETLANNNFRKVLFTAKHCQLVVMSLKPGEDIGEEIHDVDQFFRIDQGIGKTIIDGIENDVKDGFAIIVPAGAKHNVINTGDSELKLYTLYSPPNHKDGTIHETKAIAEDEEDKEHFDGQTSL